MVLQVHSMPSDGPTEPVNNEKFQGEIMEMVGAELKDGDVEECSTFHTSSI